MIEHITLSPKVNLAAGTITIDEISKIDGVRFDVELDLAQRRAAWVINTRDKMVRDALICLGWRPPVEAMAPMGGCVSADTRRRVRSQDPGTSAAAAERAATFASSHADRILAALNVRDLSAQEIGAQIGLTVVQVARRTTELQREGRLVVVQTSDGLGGECDLERDGFRVWRRLS